MSTAVLTTPPSVSPQQVQLLRKFGRFRGRVPFGTATTPVPKVAAAPTPVPVTPAANPALTRFMGKGRMGFLARRAQAMGAARTVAPVAAVVQAVVAPVASPVATVVQAVVAPVVAPVTAVVQAVVAPVVTPVVAPVTAVVQAATTTTTQPLIATRRRFGRGGRFIRK